MIIIIERKKESETKDKYLDLARKLKKTMEQEGDGDTNYGWCTWDNPQSIGKRDWKTWK